MFCYLPDHLAKQLLRMHSPKFQYDSEEVWYAKTLRLSRAGTNGEFWILDFGFSAEMPI